MQGIVVYYSKYGSTRNYAGSLAEKAGWDAADAKAVKRPDLQKYEAVVLASPIRIGKMPLRKWAKKHSAILKKKHLAVLAVGGNPSSEQEYYNEVAMKNLGFLGLKKEQCFGLGGRKIRADMKGMDAFMFKMMEKLPEGTGEREDILRDVDYYNPSDLDMVLVYLQDQNLMQKGIK
jgi:menaquinone-dependent protoporphyrinogen IX oxidase